MLLLNYCGYTSRGSRGIDIFAAPEEEFSDRPFMVIEVGSHNKPVRAALQELAAAYKPTRTICVVAKYTRNGRGRPITWQYHINTHTHFISLEKVLDEWILDHPTPTKS